MAQSVSQVDFLVKIINLIFIFRLITMSQIRFYHNPRCSKSRQALALLQEHGENPEVIEYLKTPLNLEQLKQLQRSFSLKDFVRTNEKTFKELNLSLDDEEKVLTAMLEHPILMQRPIAVSQDRVIIGRPPENVLELLK